MVLFYLFLIIDIVDSGIVELFLLLFFMYYSYIIFDDLVSVVVFNVVLMVFIKVKFFFILWIGVGCNCLKYYKVYLIGLVWMLI